jgi:hypothetical protein
MQQNGANFSPKHEGLIRFIREPTLVNFGIGNVQAVQAEKV